MAYCNWCSLETESDETCEWCKRPIRRNLGVYGYGNSVAMLREEDDLPADRVTAIFGVLIGAAFVALLLFVGLSYRGDPKASDPLSQIAESEKTWTAERSGSPSFSATPPTPPVTPTTAPRSPVAAATSKGTNSRPSPVASGGASVSAVSTTTALLDGVSDLESGSRATGFRLETAQLSASREPGGTYALRGEVKLRNSSGGRVSEIKLKVVCELGTVALNTGEQDDGLGNGSSRTFRVWATGVSRDIVNATDAFVEVEGVSESGPFRDRIPLR